MNQSRAYTRNAQLVKALRFIQLMNRSVRPTQVEIASALGVSRRVACRWIAAAVEAEIPMPPSIEHWRDR